MRHISCPLDQKVSRRKINFLPLYSIFSVPKQENQKPSPLLSNSQYSGDQEQDFLNLLSIILDRTEEILAFSIQRCVSCSQLNATLSEAFISEISPINVIQKISLINTVTDPGSYFWGSSISRLVPRFGFQFRSRGEPLASLVLATYSIPAQQQKIGQGRLLLPYRLDDPSLALLVFNARAATTLETVYSSALSQRR